MLLFVSLKHLSYVISALLSSYLYQGKSFQAFFETHLSAHPHKSLSAVFMLYLPRDSHFRLAYQVLSSVQAYFSQGWFHILAFHKIFPKSWCSLVPACPWLALSPWGQLYYFLTHLNSHLGPVWLLFLSHFLFSSLVPTTLLSPFSFCPLFLFVIIFLYFPAWVSNSFSPCLLQCPLNSSSRPLQTSMETWEAC